MQVQTARDGVYVMSGHTATHKQGKLPAGVVLNVIEETVKAYELNTEHTAAVIEIYDPDRDSDYNTYPNFWILKEDVYNSVAVPEPVSEPVDPVPVPAPSDYAAFADAGEAFVYLMAWLRELWR